MKKKDFISLVLGVAGVLVFGIGLCMCLLPEWNAFTPGVVITAMGLIALIALAVVRWVAAGRPSAHVDRKKAARALYCVASALVLGLGMSLIMAFDGMLIPGLIVGVVGVVMALGIIPVFKGFKD